MIIPESLFQPRLYFRNIHHHGTASDILPLGSFSGSADRKTGKRCIVRHVTILPLRFKQIKIGICLLSTHVALPIKVSLSAHLEAKLPRLRLGKGAPEGQLSMPKSELQMPNPNKPEITNYKHHLILKLGQISSKSQIRSNAN